MGLGVRGPRKRETICRVLSNAGELMTESRPAHRNIRVRCPQRAHRRPRVSYEASMPDPPPSGVRALLTEWSARRASGILGELVPDSLLRLPSRVQDSR